MIKREGRIFGSSPLFLCANPYAKTDAEKLFSAVFRVRLNATECGGVRWLNALYLLRLCYTFAYCMRRYAALCA